MSRHAARAAATRASILAAAAQGFAAEGFEACSVRSVAAAADVGAGTVLMHFGSKQGLLEAVWRHGALPVVDAALVAVAEAPAFVPSCMALFRPLMAHYAAQPALARVVVAALPFLEGDALQAHLVDLHRTVGALAAAAARAQHSGELRSSVEPEAVAELVFGLYYAALVGMLSAVRPSPPAAAADRLEAQLGLLLSGLGPPAQPAGPRRPRPPRSA